jgi:L-amino acid N-acyltransferase YncA
MTADAAQADYRAGIASVLGIEPTVFDAPGTTVRADHARDGLRLASRYLVGDHAVVWTEPALFSTVAELDGRPTAIGDDEFRAWGESVGADWLGRGYDHVLADGFRAPDRPGAIVVLDPAAAAAIELVAELLDSCSDDDRDEAEFELDALDEVLVGWLEGDRLLALAGGREWSARPGFRDIGVIVHPAARRRGLGQAVVEQVTTEILMRGHRPLYRCNDENTGSVRLCRAVGFEVACLVSAVRFPDPG